MVEQPNVTEAVQNSKRDFVEVDVFRLWKALWKRLWLLVIVAVLGAVAAFVWTKFMITPQYKSAAMFYVNNSSVSLGDASLSISAGDITASKSLVGSYIVILETRGTLLDVIDYAGLDCSVSSLKSMLSAKAVDDTEIFQVEVTNPSPQDAEKIANAIAYVLPKRIASIIEGSSAKVVDYGVIPAAPSSPSYTKNVVLGVLLCMVLCGGVIILVEVFDVTIKEEEDITRCCTYPLLAAVPDMTSSGKSGRYYGYGQKKTTERQTTEKHNVVGSNISFSASEAYKLLRTKIQYSFTDDTKCRVIAISSAMAGEGKSVSSVNLANTLAQFNERVLLIDCDLRRPTMAEKLSLKKKPGLSDYLTGSLDVNGLFQRYSSDKENNLFYVITAGPNPPNPIELLSSGKMEKLMQSLRELFDYIILDMPPINEVSDALVSAKIADGILLVVRQNYCNSIALREAMRQFEFVGSRILGVVSNCATESNNKKYGYRKYGYRRYGYRYYGYGRSYSGNNNVQK